MNHRNYQDAGFKVFGLYGATNGVCDCETVGCTAPFKHPISKGWQNTPEWDDDQLSNMEMAGQFSTGFGVLCNGYLVVESWLKLDHDLQGALMACNFIVKTGSGGDSRHLYFKAPEGVSLATKHNSYPGIDFKSTGYVVGAGSMHLSGAIYEILSGSLEEITEAPSNLIDILRRKDLHRAEYNGRQVDIADNDINTMLAYVNPDIDRDTWCKVGMAIHEATNGEGLELWDLWSAKGTKYRGINDIRKTWESFGKKEGITIGTLVFLAEANGWQQPVTFLSDEFAVKHWTSEGMFVDIEDLMSDISKPDWLIKGILERGSMNLLFGEPGAGKSLFAMDWAFCLGAGIAWHNHKVKKKCKVLYILGEGFRGVTMRFQALKQKYPDADVSNIKFSRRSINLLDPKASEQVIEIIKDLDFIPDLIICDTLNRNMVGDENSTEDMGRFFISSELFIKELNSTFLTVHHSGHADKGRSRGSSAIKAAMDAEFCVAKNGEGITFSCTKSKDFSADSDMKFNLHQVELEGEMFFDEDDNKQITSVYLNYNGESKKLNELNPNHQKVLDSLESCLKTHGKIGFVLSEIGEDEMTVSWKEWAPFIDECHTTKNNDRFRGYKKDLLNQGIIANNGDRWWIK